MGRRVRLYRVGLALAVLGCACAAPRVAQPQLAPVASPAPVLIAAGDIADCRNPAREATARLLDGLAGTIAALGDEAYPTGSAEDYANCYDPTWGPYKARTRPALGNHEYDTPEAAGYFGYFGDAGGAPGQGYYSYDLGTWHVVGLNSNCWQIGGRHAGAVAPSGPRRPSGQLHPRLLAPPAVQLGQQRARRRAPVLGSALRRPR